MVFPLQCLLGVPVCRALLSVLPSAPAITNHHLLPKILHVSCIPKSRQSCGMITGTFGAGGIYPFPSVSCPPPEKQVRLQTQAARQQPLPSAICLGSAKALRVTDCHEFLPAPPQHMPGIIVLILLLILERQTPFCIRVVEVSLLCFIRDNRWDTPSQDSTFLFQVYFLSSLPVRCQGDCWHRLGADTGQRHVVPGRTGR